METGSLLSMIRDFERKIKERKREILHEREMNAMLFEENENLRSTNKVLSKQDEHKGQPNGFSMNARVAANIYENLKMGDLKTEIQRTQGQIHQLQDRHEYSLNDIESIKKHNKQMEAAIDRYKKILELAKPKKTLVSTYL